MDAALYDMIQSRESFARERKPKRAIILFDSAIPEMTGQVAEEQPIVDGPIISIPRL